MADKSNQHPKKKSESAKSLPLQWRRGNRYGETFKRFMQCLQWAKEGKTYIYYHPDFVAIDHKSWEAIDKILHPPKNTIIYYDEYQDWTPEMQERLNDLLATPPTIDTLRPSEAQSVSTDPIKDKA